MREDPHGPPILRPAVSLRRPRKARKRRLVDRKETMPRRAVERGRKSASGSGQRLGLDLAPSHRFALQKGLAPLGRLIGRAAQQANGGDQTARCPAILRGLLHHGDALLDARLPLSAPGPEGSRPGGSRPGRSGPRRSGPGSGPGFGPRRQDRRPGGQTGASRTSYPAGRPPRPSSPRDGDSQTTRPPSVRSSRPAKPWQRTGSSSARPSGRPGEKPEGRFGGKPGGKPGGRPGGKPEGRFGGKPGGKPVGKPGKPAGNYPPRKPARKKPGA